MALKSSSRIVAAPTNGTNRFEPVTTEVKRRLIVSVEGQEKSGKSHFALSAPGPIYIQNLDNGLEGVVQKFADKVEVKKVDYCQDLILPLEIEMLNGQEYVQGVASHADRIWSNFKSDYAVALEVARTNVWDTGDEAWELVRLARWGKLTEVKPHHYGPVNREFRTLIDMAYSSSCNLIMLHKVKDEYANDKATGKKKRAGFKDATYASQVNVRCFREDGTCMMEVLDCRQNIDIIGMQIPNDFMTLAQAVFPDSSPEEWK